MAIVLGSVFSGVASFVLKEAGLSIVQESILSIVDLTKKSTNAIENVKEISKRQIEIESPFGTIIKKESELTSAWIQKASFFQIPETSSGVMIIFFKPFETNSFGPIVQSRSLAFYETFAGAESPGNFYKSNIEGTRGTYGLNSFLELPEYSSLIQSLVPKEAIDIGNIALDQVKTIVELKEFAFLFGRKASISSRIAETRGLLGQSGLTRDERNVLNGRVGGLSRQKNIVDRSLNRKTKNIGQRVFKETGIPVANKQKASRILLKLFPFF